MPSARVDVLASVGTILAAIVALAALLRVLHIGAQSLWIDEYLTLEVATPSPTLSALWQLLRHNNPRAAARYVRGRDFFAW